MKKMFAAVSAFALIATAGIASASDSGNFFVNGSVGQSNYRTAGSSRDDYSSNSVDKKDTAYALRFGYRWHSVVDYGVEAGYVDLGNLNSKYRINGFTDSIGTKVNSRGYLLGGNLKYNIDDHWYVSARAGWFRSRIQSKYDYKYFGYFNRDSTHTTGTGEYAGLGVGYNFSPAFSLGLNYDNYHSRSKYGHTDYIDDTGINTAAYSLSAEYRF